jgi:hypothetical protein
MHKDDVEQEICDFLDALTGLFTGKITFSCMLPTMDTTFIRGMSMINASVRKHCLSNGYGVFFVSAFTRNLGGLIGPTLFARDGLHLGPAGIQAVYEAIRAYVMDDFKYVHTRDGPYC